MISAVQHEKVVLCVTLDIVRSPKLAVTRACRPPHFDEDSFRIEFLNAIIAVVNDVEVTITVQRYTERIAELSRRSALRANGHHVGPVRFQHLNAMIILFHDVYLVGGGADLDV